MILLIDENLPRFLAQTMHPIAALEGHRVEHILDRYTVGVSDVEWLTDLASEPDAAFLSCDVRIRKNAPEVQALQRAGLVGFWLRSKSWQERLRRYRQHELAWRLIQHWPQIVSLTQAARSQVYEIPPTGKKMKGL